MEVDADTARRIARLHSHAKRKAWMQTDIDWPAQGTRTRRFQDRVLKCLVLKYLHGEHGTASACLVLADRSSSAVVAAFLRTQAAEEYRHAAVYARYLDVRGFETVIDGELQRVYRAAANASDPLVTFLFFHQLLEEHGIMFQRWLLRTASCPLLAAINRRIVVDEARHVAFGRWVLAAQAARIDAPRRRAVRQGALALWHELLDREFALLHPAIGHVLAVEARWSGRRERHVDRRLGALGWT